MPLIDFFNIDDNTKIVTWEVSEEHKTLLNYLQLDMYRIKKYKSLSKKKGKEYLGLHSCLKVLGIKNDVFYYADGSPYINLVDYYISISHSQELVSFGISNYKIGVDIEKNRLDKIFDIKNKFISKSEDFYLKFSNESDYLHIIWGIKEGLFKLYHGNSWNFLHHYRVDFFDLSANNPISCWVLTDFKSQKYYALYKKIKDYFLVYVLDYLPKKNNSNI